MATQGNPTQDNLMNPNDLLNAKNGLLKHYTDEQGSSSTRLIGFFAALFALSQGLQRVGDGKSISGAFPAIDAWLQGNCLSSLPEQLKLSLLFATFFVLLTFVFRAIFRFATYGLMVSELLGVNCSQIRGATSDFVNKENEENAKDKNDKKIKLIKLTEEDIELHFRIHLGVASSIKEKNHRIFGIFRAKWFLEAYDKSWEGLWGWLICFSMSTFMTTLVLWFIW